jgi:hypothetical protein
VQASRGDQDLGDLVAVRGAVLAGIVRDANRQPVEGVSVMAHLGAIGINAQSQTKSAVDGSFRVGKLRPGKWTLRTASSRFLPIADRRANSSSSTASLEPK